MKKNFWVTLTSAFLLSNSSITSIYANDNIDNNLDYNKSRVIASNYDYFDIIPENNLARGANKPTGSSFVDLNNTSYGFNVEELKVNVYTNTFFKGTKYINVQVNKINVDKNGMANQSVPITVKLYKKGSNIPVESKSVSLNGGTIKFSDLDKDTLYYICFSKATDTQIYSFDGLIY